MRQASTLLIVGLLGTVVAGCGHTTFRTSSTARIPSNVVDQRNARAEEIAKYGKEAGSADKTAITTLVKAFYNAAGVDDGAKACTLLYSVLAEEIPDTYGKPPGPPSLSGKTCAEVMSKLFRQVPAQPRGVLATTEVTGVRVKGRKGIALLRSRGLPSGYVPVERELGYWKVAALVGRPIPGTSSAYDEIPGTDATDATGTSAAINSPEEARNHPGTDANDGDGDPGSNDDGPVLDFGHAAKAVDRHAIAKTVERYYEAAAADSGTGACATIYPVTAEAIPEKYEQIPGLGGKSCDAVMTKLFARSHRKLASELNMLKVTRVRIEGDKALAFVFLGKTPEPYVLLHQDGRAWKMESLTEKGLP